MDSLRINTGTKKIQINDGPEFLEFNPGDLTFAERFYGLIGEFETKMAEYQDRSIVISGNAVLDARGIPANMEDQLNLMREACTFVREKIDHLFGAGTSQKCFGDVQNMDVFTQFFQGIMPFIQSARANKIAPYMNPVVEKRKKHAALK